MSNLADYIIKNLSTLEKVSDSPATRHVLKVLADTAKTNPGATEEFANVLLQNKNFPVYVYNFINSMLRNSAASSTASSPARLIPSLIPSALALVPKMSVDVPAVSISRAPQRPGVPDFDVSANVGTFSSTIGSRPALTSFGAERVGGPKNYTVKPPTRQELSTMTPELANAYVRSQGPPEPLPIGATQQEREAFMRNLPSAADRRTDSLPTQVLEYLRSRGQNISLDTIKSLLSKYKTGIIAALSIAAVAALVYAGYRLYKYFKPGTSAAAIPEDIKESTVADVIKALSAEYAWVRNNIGTVRSMLVNGVEAGNFEKVVENIIETARNHSGSGLRKKRKNTRGHRGAGVMMV